MLDLSVVIVNFNTKEFLKNCIESIVENISDKIKYEIVVVDNASSDGSIAEIRNSKFEIRNNSPKLKIIVNKVNLGFSAANNIGIRASADSKYILFLNSDTLIQKNTLEKMISFMDSHKDIGASTCKVVMPNGKIDDASHRGFPTPWNSFCHFSGLEKMLPKNKLFAGYTLGCMDIDSVHEIDVLAGAFMLVRRSAGDEARWWDEDYFFYGEDIDFCYILKKLGWKIYYVPDVSVFHFKGVSGGIKKISKNITTASKVTIRKVTKSRFDAMKIFYRKHYEKQYPWIINQLVYLGIIIRKKL